MNQVIIQIHYGKELYSEVKSEKNVATADVPKVAAYLADKLAIRAGETAEHEKRRQSTRRARETRRAKEDRYTAGGKRAQQA